MLATLADAPLTRPQAGLRAEVRRHPRAHRGDARRERGPRVRDLVAQRQRQDVAVSRDRRGARGGRGDGSIGRSCSTARSSPSTTRPAGRLPAAAGTHAPDRRRAISSASSKAQPAAFIAFDILRDGNDDLVRLPLTRAPRAAGTLFERIFRVKGEAGHDPASASRSRTTAGAARARDERALGRPDRQGRLVRLPGRDGARRRGARSSCRPGAGVRGRRLDRAAADAAVLRRAAARRLRAPVGSTYVGHTGTGFDQKELARVWKLLKAREIATSPFADADQDQRAARTGCARISSRR